MQLHPGLANSASSQRRIDGLRVIAKHKRSINLPCFIISRGKSYAAAVLSGNFPFCSGSRVGCICLDVWSGL